MKLNFMKINTDEQQKIVENVFLAMTDSEKAAFINFGGEMYREGLVAGIGGVLVGAGTGIILNLIGKAVIEFVEERRSKKLIEDCEKTNKKLGPWLVWIKANKQD